MHPEDAVTAHGHICPDDTRPQNKDSEKETSDKNWKVEDQELTPALYK